MFVQATAADGDLVELDEFPEIDVSGIALNGKVALMTGITGQDGSYLAELLLSKV